MRKNVLKVRIRHNRTGPRIGQDIREYYRNITHLAKDCISKDINEAWEFVYVFFEEDTDKFIENKLRMALSHVSNDRIDSDDTLVVFRRGNKWFKYVDYNIGKIDPIKLV